MVLGRWIWILLALCAASTACAAISGASAFAAAAAAADPANEASNTSPINKVVELLNVLKRQVEEDGEADNGAHKEYLAWYENTSATLKRISEEAKQQSEILDAEIKEAAASLDSERKALEATIAALEQAHTELQNGTARRTKEAKNFQNTSYTLVAAVSQLERALLVLGAQEGSADDELMLPAGSPAFPSSLAAVAATVKHQLSSVSFSAGQRRTLEGFLNEAATAAGPGASGLSRKTHVRMARPDGHSSRRGDAKHAAEAVAPALGFLQVNNAASGPDGEYESSTGGVITTLQSVLDETQEELAAARREEASAVTEFKSLEAELTEEIENKKRAMSDHKATMSQLQESSAQMGQKLAEARKMMNVTDTQLVHVTAEYESRTEGFESRKTKRADEISAIQEALATLTSDEAKETFDGSNAASPSPSPSFLQQGMKAKTLLGGRHRHRRLGGKHGQQSLSTATQSDAEKSRDPFENVKKLVREMLEKLEKEQAQETQQHEYCASETAKGKKSQEDKQRDIDKLQSRIDSLNAELEQLATDGETTQRDLADAKSGLAEAEELRQKERQVAATSLQQYKDAQKIIGSAVAALQKFYGPAASASEGDGSSDADFQANGGASGVFALLELAASDYAKLQSELETSEAAAEQELKQLTKDTEVRIAALQKDVEYIERFTVQRQTDRMRIESDLKASQKELEAINSYLEQLEASCATKVETYEERKRRRDAELESLKDALETLSGATGAGGEVAAALIQDLDRAGLGFGDAKGGRAAH